MPVSSVKRAACRRTASSSEPEASAEGASAAISVRDSARFSLAVRTASASRSSASAGSAACSRVMMLVKPWARVSWISPASRSRSAATPASCDEPGHLGAAGLAARRSARPARRSARSTRMIQMPIQTEIAAGHRRRSGARCRSIRGSCGRRRPGRSRASQLATITSGMAGRSGRTSEDHRAQREQQLAGEVTPQVTGPRRSTDQPRQNAGCSRRPGPGTSRRPHSHRGCSATSRRSAPAAISRRPSGCPSGQDAPRGDADGDHQRRTTSHHCA